ncbi:zinc finger MYND domain-containing protein [Phanerochaete sordida]|uniref:Zinc finger MYND domain-containing protein n=1 Tax=Phanerochaete sordida TaxID=48140 RepID=A0A9P3FYY1_9APHY|nr:zinc finger MYND domain-containing protein [Phanerochaete sordida]
MVSWHASEYSKVLDIGTMFTLSELRRHWTLYAGTKTFASERKAHFNKQFRDAVKKTSKSASHVSDAMIYRSAGPCTLKAMNSSYAASTSFWATGTTFTSQHDVGTATEVNPTFAYSFGGEGFSVHQDTHPLAAFHLARVFSVVDTSAPPTLEQIYADVRTQFRAWCDTFYTYLQGSASRLTIRFIVADALALCEALQLQAARADPSIFPRVSPWRASLMVLDGQSYSAGSAPLSFDVIHTSSLVDSLGVLNIVVATRPLLKPTPSATLYTESLLASGEDPVTSFADSLCGEMSTMSLLFDLTPTSYLSGYNTQSNTHELMGFRIRNDGLQYQERVTWKIPSQLSPTPTQVTALSFDPSDFAALVLEIYRKMFAHEDIAAFLQKAPTPISLQALERIHNSRRGFVVLMRSLVPRVAVAWTEVCALFERMVANDSTLLLGRSRYQDLVLQLHLAGLWSVEPLAPNSSLRFADKTRGPFRDWSNIPHVVCVVFVVPRARFQPLEDTGAPVNPPLAAEFGTDELSSYFCSFEPAFGTLAIEGAGEHARAIITEDPRGKAGGGDVVVSVCVPAWILVAPNMATMVRVVLLSTPSSSVLNSKLGMRMIVYDAPLADKTLVHVLRERPTVPGGARALIPQMPSIEAPSASSAVAIGVEGERIDKMTRRTEIDDPAAKAALASKETPVVVHQAGASGVKLSIGTSSHEMLSFPFPVDAAHAKLRVARKSAWIEVVAAPCLLSRQDAPMDIRFPLTVRAVSPVPWAIHRVNLDRLPAIRTENARVEQIDWINTQASLAFSDRELQARASHSLDVLGEIKDSIFTILVSAAGLQGPKSVVFEIVKAPGDIDTVLFVDKLRLDVSAHSVVADAYVLSLHTSFSAEIQHLLPSLTRRFQIDIAPAEHSAWKCLLPSLAERCRTWGHAQDCVYTAPSARIPLSTKSDEDPLCGCGRGKVGDSFRATAEWAPFEPYVTRIALSPLFAVSYLESVGAKLEGLAGLAARATTQAQGQRSAGAATSAQADAVLCGACGSSIVEERPMICSRCKKVAYCSRDCQSKDWKAHKRSCKAV